MTAKKNTPAATWDKGGGEPGRDMVDYLNSTTMKYIRQVVKISLPWIATIVTSTRFTDRKSRFLDRLIFMAEGGQHE